MADRIKIHVDRDDCISCGSCWATCPDVFEESPSDALSQIVEAYRQAGDPGKGEAPADLKACIDEAAESCPVQVIHVD